MLPEQERVAQLLELIHAAPDSFKTVRLVAEGWYECGGRGSEDGRLWYKPPAHVRREGMFAGELHIEISDGRRRWTSSDSERMLVEQEKPDLQSAAEMAAYELDASRLLPVLEIESIEATVHGGRRAYLVRGRTRRSSMDSLRFGDFTEATDRAQMVVDKERGVLLRLDLWQGERHVRHRELVELVFDEELPDSTFTYQASADVRLEDWDAQERAFEEMPRTLKEALPLMPFPVWILGELDPAWSMSAFGWPGASQRGQGRAQLSLRYTRFPEERYLSAIQHLELDEWELPADVPESDEVRIERGAGQFEIWSLTDPEKNQRRVKVLVTIGRTQIQLHSSDFTEDELVAFADQLVPAPSEPPGSDL